jgi:hypothetical protein
MNLPLTEHTAPAPVPGSPLIALRNERALFALLVTGLLVFASAFLGFRFFNPGSYAIKALFLFNFALVLPIGTSIAGLLLMDQAGGRSPRPFGEVIFEAFAIFPRIIGVALAILAFMLLLGLIFTLLLFVCKLPFVGPALYAVFLPVMLILGGLSYLFIIVIKTVALPAIWNGADFRETYIAVLKMASERLSELLLSLLLLLVLSALAVTVMFLLFSVGQAFVQCVSALVPGDALSFARLQSVLQSVLFGSFSQNEYSLAAVLGYAICFSLMLAVLTAINLMGFNLIYLRLNASQGRVSPFACLTGQEIPPSPPHETPQAEFPIKTPPAVTQPHDMPQPVLFKEPTLTVTPSVTPPPAFLTEPPPPPVSPVSQDTSKDNLDIFASLLGNSPPPAPSVCPNCQASLQPGDRFCGECGYKLPG